MSLIELKEIGALDENKDCDVQNLMDNVNLGTEREIQSGLLHGAKLVADKSLEWKALFISSDWYQ